VQYGLCSVLAQITNALSIHSGFYQSRMIDDNQKMFIPHLIIDNDFFHSAFGKAQSEWCAPYCAFAH
jgi:hypothetical protein